MECWVYLVWISLDQCTTSLSWFSASLDAFTTDIFTCFTSFTLCKTTPTLPTLWTQWPTTERVLYVQTNCTNVQQPKMAKNNYGILGDCTGHTLFYTGARACTRTHAHIVILTWCVFWVSLILYCCDQAVGNRFNIGKYLWAPWGCELFTTFIMLGWGYMHIFFVSTWRRHCPGLKL